MSNLQGRVNRLEQKAGHKDEQVKVVFIPDHIETDDEWQQYLDQQYPGFEGRIISVCFVTPDYQYED